MRTVAIIASNALALLATLPYIIGIVKGRQKPRVATWLVWAVLAGIGSAAAFSSHQIPAAIFTLTTAFEYGIVVLLGIRYGDRAFGKLDIGCLLVAMLGLAVLIVVKSPIAALVVVIVTDAIGTIPTIVHSWRQPEEESWVSFALYVLAEITTLTVADFRHFTAFAYPAFYLIEDVILMSIMLFSPNKQRSPSPASQQDGSVHAVQEATGIKLPEGSQAGSVTKPVVATSPVFGAPQWGSEGLNEILIPVAGHTLGIARGECFVGQSDPGVGRGTPINFMNGNLVVPINPNLSTGSYRVQIRVMDTAGNWSQLLPIQWTVGADKRVEPSSLPLPSA